MVSSPSSIFIPVRFWLPYYLIQELPPLFARYPRTVIELMKDEKSTKPAIRTLGWMIMTSTSWNRTRMGKSYNLRLVQDTKPSRAAKRVPKKHHQFHISTPKRKSVHPFRPPIHHQDPSAPSQNLLGSSDQDGKVAFPNILRMHLGFREKKRQIWW